MKRALLLIGLLLGVGARAGTAPAAPLPSPAAAAPAAMALAIVVADQTALRAEARDSATQHAVLWAGDRLEVRAERLDFVQVYDHRRERAGFVRQSQVRRISLAAADAPELMAVVRFLRDSPGDEALGIAYAAAYLQAAPASAIGAEIFDALGTLADRLAERASANRSAARNVLFAAHLELAASYGIKISSFMQGGRMRLCYDGEAFRRVLALEASDPQKANAALALTRPDCVDPDLTPVARHALDDWRREVLDRAPRQHLSELLKNRLRLRSAAVWASIAFQRSRRGEDAGEAAARAVDELASVAPAQLAESDGDAMSEAAIRVGASRWAAEAAPRNKSTLRIVTRAGEPGQTCIALVDPQHGPEQALLSRCTFGTVWTQSARVNAQGSALALAVQPLEGWRELWLFHKSGDGWLLDIAPPGSDGPDLGYIEFAGWVPGGKQLLAARETRSGGHFQRSFELLDIGTLKVLKQAEQPAHLSPFYRWQDPEWKRQTLSLR
ncbi:MAG: hypothetical protein AB7V26_12080 [Lysobacterales bacterium]